MFDGDSRSREFDVQTFATCDCLQRDSATLPIPGINQNKFVRSVLGNDLHGVGAAREFAKEIVLSSASGASAAKRETN
jgi:hypothetical protein